MSFRTDPIRIQRAIWLTLLIAGGIITALLTAAPWILPSENAKMIPVTFDAIPEVHGAPEEVEESREPLEASAFTARLWNPPPAPEEDRAEEEAEKARPRQPPPDLDLIAIVREEHGPVAALFDPSANELRLLGVGETVAGYQVSAIDGDTITMTAGRSEHTIVLIPPGGRR